MTDHPVRSMNRPASERAHTTRADDRRSNLGSSTALVLIGLSALLFSLGGLFVRSLDRPDAWTTVFWRSLSACVTIAAYVTWQSKGRVVATLKALGRPGLVVALAFSVSSISMVVALNRTSVSVVLVLFSLAPLVTALAARAMLGEMIATVTWAAIAATVVGVCVMVWGPGTTATPSGILIALTIPVAFAIGTVVIRQHQHITMVPAMLAACLINVVISLPVAKPWDVNRHDLIVLVLFGAAQLGVGLTIFAVAAPNAPSAQAALVSMLEPVAGPLWVWAFKNEYPGIAGFVGGGIVFAALAIHTIVVARSSASTPGSLITSPK
jgi:drug/metabolite transporter (DMT)-like permease